MGAKALTRLQEKFVLAYLSDPQMNATAAVRKAGYQTKYPDKVAYQLLGNTRVARIVKAAKDKLAKKAEEKYEITSEKWLRELAVIGFSNMPDYMTIEDGGGVVFKTFEEMPKDASRAIEVIEESRTIKEDAGNKDKKSESVILNDKIKFKLHSKLEALKLIGEHLGYLKGNRIDLPGLEKALYEISEKFLPAVDGKKKRSDEPQ